VRYEVQYTPTALKQLAKMDRQVAQRIRRFFAEVLDLDNPRSKGAALVNRDEWRYRVGDYRVLCEIRDDVLVVLVVGAAHRRPIYDRR
jgi:mRNA interferase RelE/StbE